MNPLEEPVDEPKLQEFFGRNKTEMSCMDNPQTFLNQLRDNKLIPEEKYKKMIRIKSIDKMKTSVYELLDWIETERPKTISFFWTCVFKEIIMTQYPTLKRLRDSLLDGSFQFFDGEDSDKHTRGGLSEEEYPEKERGGRGKRGSFCDRDDRQRQSSSQATPRKRRNLMKPTFGSFPLSDESSGEHAREGLSDDKSMRKERGGRDKLGRFCHRDEQQGHSSSQASPRKRKPTFGILSFTTRGASLPKGENVEIWTLDKYRHQLPVTCGDEQGTLYRDKLAKGEPCILRSKKWYTPCAFQKLSGKGSKWKKSIRCKDTTLEKLLKDGHLTCPGYNKSKAKKSTLPCSSNTVSAIPENGEEMEEEEGEEEELQANPDEEEVSMEDEVELQGNDCSTQRSGTDQGDHLEEVTEERPRVGQNEFRVICGALSGMLHSSRFASGRCGNSFRTEDRWMSPVEFVEQGSAMPNAPWRRDIQWEGQPLSSSLIERKMLHLHSEQCDCPLCHPDPKALAGEEDDEEEEEEEERPNLEADQAPPSTPNPASSLSQFPLLFDPLTTTSSTSHPPTTLMASTSTSSLLPPHPPTATRVASATSSSLSDPTTTLMTSAFTSSLLPPHPATTLTAVASTVPQSVTPSSHPPTPRSSASRGGKRKRKSVRPNTDPCETARLDRMQESRQEMEKVIERVEERERENERERERDRMRERDMNDIHFSFTNYLCQFMQTLPQGKSAFAMRDIRQLMRDYEPI